MASRSAGSGASGDVFTLNEDGTVTLGWDGVSATLRRPTVGEWLSFMEQSETADEWAKGDSPEDAEPTPRTVMEALRDGPFLALYQRMLAELGDTRVETTDMPPWLALGTTFGRISNWWVTNPLSRRDQAAAMRTLSQ